MNTAQIKTTDKRLEALRAEFEAKEKELEARKKESEDLRNQLLRLQADFENAKKRWLKAQAESQETAHGQLLKELLEIVDDFERACGATSSAEPGVFKDGVMMVAKRMQEFLKLYGVNPVEARGKLFDPNLHEAVAHEERQDLPESTVLEELRKGYLMNGKVLRTAVVKVSVKPGLKDSKEV